MRDIQTRADLELIMGLFYQKLLSDDTISYIFTDVAKINLAEHLPHIVNFWEQNLLGTAKYSNNVLKIHLDLNDKVQLEPHHFQTWLMRLYTTVDANFEGEIAETMKTRALSIATVMKIKIQNLN